MSSIYKNELMTVIYIPESKYIFTNKFSFINYLVFHKLLTLFGTGMLLCLPDSEFIISN